MTGLGRARSVRQPTSVGVANDEQVRDWTARFGLDDRRRRPPHLLRSARVGLEGQNGRDDGIEVTGVGTHSGSVGLGLRRRRSSVEDQRVAELAAGHRETDGHLGQVGYRKAVMEDHHADIASRRPEPKRRLERLGKTGRDAAPDGDGDGHACQRMPPLAAGRAGSQPAPMRSASFVRAASRSGWWSSYPIVMPASDLVDEVAHDRGRGLGIRGIRSIAEDHADGGSEALGLELRAG